MIGAFEKEKEISKNGYSYYSELIIILIK